MQRGPSGARGGNDGLVARRPLHGPVLGKEPTLFKVEPNFVGECGVAAAKGKSMKPALPELDAAASALADLLKTAAPTINEAAKYYEQKDYKDDKLAKGKAMHPQLVGIFRSFDRVSSALGSEFVKHKDPLDVRDLERLKAKGPALAYLTKRSILDATKFSKVLDVASVAEFFALRPTDLQTRVDVVSNDLDELQKFVETHPKEMEGTFMVSSYAHDLEGFVKEAKEVTRRIRDQKKFTDSELNRLGTGAGWMTSGSPDSLENKHKDLVKTYNNMRI